MLDRVRHNPLLGEVRRRVRGKLVRAVDEVVRRYHDDQADRIERLRGEVAELRKQNDDLRHQVDRAVDTTIQSEIRARRDLVFAGEQEAALQSARFVRAHMPTAPHFGHPHATLEHALGLVEADGMALEFGVYTGSTLKLIATARGGRDVYGFDSFQGLPEDWRNGFPAGTFDVDGLPEVDGAELVVGWFDDTLPGFLGSHPGPVAFLHVDCDLYSSTRTVLELVGPRLVPGSVVVFDEYFNFPGWQDHEHKAWTEYVARTGIAFDYVGYTYDHEQVIVKVTGAPHPVREG
ncbi:class I SAM-dependent methyltransferase [Saccharothrix syringae]|uniref:Class I SAM-dependent methyltransferase n=1 Tax=Saccharothrix syringae TaxID=103733 RepID=A0A5Q0GS38_SACSY|nr:class I SAM-dependent methyltransferase [Saccharothrix syringae]QFZ16182.1 class I SAM-dependent methyltransferase [Saccharothrix syringae]